MFLRFPPPPVNLCEDLRFEKNAAISNQKFLNTIVLRFCAVFCFFYMLHSLVFSIYLSLRVKLPHPHFPCNSPEVYLQFINLQLAEKKYQNCFCNFGLNVTLDATAQQNNSILVQTQAAQNTLFCKWNSTNT